MQEIYGIFKPNFPIKCINLPAACFASSDFKEATQTRQQHLHPNKRKKNTEEQFYQSFADWLVNELEECTKAIPLGGNRFGTKWGTPDVIGKLESKKSDIVKAPVEIVAAEIKTDTSQLVTAFGQACAYCLFSHKSYLVVPRSAPEEELSRLDALCLVFGIGLIKFNSENPKDPDYKILSRAKYQRPDFFYTNQNVKLVESELFSS